MLQQNYPVQSFDSFHETITNTNVLPNGDLERRVSSESSSSEGNEDAVPNPEEIMNGSITQLLLVED